MTGSGPPLRKVPLHELTEDQQALYHRLTTGPRASGPQHFGLIDDDGCLEGPFNGFLLQPVLGERLQALGAAIRFETGLTDRARELAILVVAATWQSEFEQFAHEAIARSIGIQERELMALPDGIEADTAENWPNADDLLIVRLTRALSGTGDLDDELYASGVEALGEAGLFELMTLVGYYATLALQLRVFRVSAPEP